ncbi:MAG: DUF5606 domain-containing protein [Flavobacteriales bacterium AspAUS03]
MQSIDFSKIIDISGKSVLYKLLSQTRNNFVITSLMYKKTYPNGLLDNK